MVISYARWWLTLRVDAKQNCHLLDEALTHIDPQFARFHGAGSLKDASSFVCVTD